MYYMSGVPQPRNAPVFHETQKEKESLVVVQDDEGHEWVFKGANTCNDFCDWLFGNMDRLCVSPTTLKGMIRISF